MRAAIVDPGDFSPQYNLALASAMQGKLARCWLIGRHGFDETRRPSFRRDHFYRPATWPVVSNKAVRIAKGLCHLPDLWRLESWIARERIDVVHFQWLPLPMIDRPVIARMARRRALIVTMHDSNPYNGDADDRMTRGLDLALAAADKVIVHTTLAAQRLAERGLPSSKIAHLPHGLLHETFAGPALGQVPNGRLRLLQFGKIKPYKGVDLIIEALRRLGPAVRDNLEVHIVGKPYMDMQPIVDKVSNYGLSENVKLQLTYLPENEIGEVFARADVALFPYREIDASGVVMTAIAQGLPIIASRVGGFAEMFADGEGGTLFDSGDVDALAKTLEVWALDRNIVVQQRAAMAVKRASIPSWNEIADRTVDLYKTVLHDKAIAPAVDSSCILAQRHG